MATNHSKVRNPEAPRAGIPAKERDDAILAIHQIIAIVELIRFHEEAQIFIAWVSDLNRRGVIQLKNYKGVDWPGEVEERAISNALYGVFDHAKSVLNTLNAAETI